MQPPVRHVSRLSGVSRPLFSRDGGVMSTRALSVGMLRDELLTGVWLGFLILGVGGRAVMRGIALMTDAPSAVSVGGTVTVLAAGTAAGIGGALLHALSRLA